MRKQSNQYASKQAQQCAINPSKAQSFQSMREPCAISPINMQAIRSNAQALKTVINERQEELMEKVQKQKQVKRAGFNTVHKPENKQRWPWPQHKAAIMAALKRLEEARANGYVREQQKCKNSCRNKWQRGKNYRWAAESKARAHSNRS